MAVKIRKNPFILLLFFLVHASAFSGAGFASEVYSESDIIGEAFGRPVTKQEFEYYYKTAVIFTRTGKEDRAEEEIIQEVWENLIFRQGARELKIAVSPEELREELARLLSEKGIEYGTEDYYAFVMIQLNEDVSVFERRIENLLIINKFMELKTNPQVSVTEEEMKQKFLNQYNSFESEYIRFENEEEAEEFFEKVKQSPRLWKDTYTEKRVEGQKGAAWINVMSLEALIDLWKIPKEDAYRILSHKEGEFIVAKFFYGDAVFRLLRKKKADLEKYNEKKREYYKKMLTTVKKRKLVKDYFEGLLERANYRDYVAEEKRAAKIEELKKKSLLMLETTRGNIELKLFPEIAPLACENFIGLAEKGYYDGLFFHRVVKDFMIQGGDPAGTGTGGESIWGEPFVDEVSDELIFDRPGLLAMANSGPNTNKSQFFITVKPTSHLNRKHTIFGEVIYGFDVVEKISNSATDVKDKPLKEQKIIKVYLKEDGPEKE